MRHEFETTLQRALDMAEDRAGRVRRDEPGVGCVGATSAGRDAARRLQSRPLPPDARDRLRTGRTRRLRTWSRRCCVRRPNVGTRSCSRRVARSTRARTSGDVRPANAPPRASRSASAARPSGSCTRSAPTTVPPTESDVRYLEVTARRASERIAMLRAFEKSETQAQSDPLTGLLNRRSLENQVNDLQRSSTPYSLAYGDLDHFKVLNDTHGHEAGDQALRLFSRVLRDSIRPNDIARPVRRRGVRHRVARLQHRDRNRGAGARARTARAHAGERAGSRLHRQLRSGRVGRATRSTKSSRSPTTRCSPPRPKAATASSLPPKG